MRKRTEANSSSSVWRTVEECVLSDGCFKPRKSLSVVLSLCSLLENRNVPGGRIHPDTVEIGKKGAVRINGKKLPLTARQKYIPPEKLRASVPDRTDDVYALGMLTLFMTSGTENKSELDSSVENSVIRETVTRCTSFDPENRFRSVNELSRFIKRKKWAPGKLAVVLLMAVVIFAVAFAGRNLFYIGVAEGEGAGGPEAYRSGYAEGFENGFSDARGIGVGIAEIPEGAGNLSGNYNALQNGAFAVSGDEVIYFVASNKICSFEPYSCDYSVLLEKNGAFSLNFYNGQLYYSADDGIYCYNPATGKNSCICTEKTGLLVIAENEFYIRDLKDTGYLYSLNPDTGKVRQMNGMNDFENFCVYGGRIFYSSAKDGYRLHSCLPDGSEDSVLSSSCCKSIGGNRGELYCGSDEGLIRIDVSAGGTEKYASMTSHNVVAGSDGVFCICGNSRSLQWMSSDSRISYTVESGPVECFNLAGRWIFYKSTAGSGLTAVRTDGSQKIEID